MEEELEEELEEEDGKEKVYTNPDPMDWAVLTDEEFLKEYGNRLSEEEREEIERRIELRELDHELLMRTIFEQDRDFIDRIYEMSEEEYEKAFEEWQSEYEKGWERMFYSEEYSNKHKQNDSDANQDMEKERESAEGDSDFEGDKEK